MAITFSQLGKQGRLGNQIWQLSATIAAALRNNYDYLFPHWDYEDDFNLHNCFSPRLEVKKIYQEPYFHFSPIPNEDNLDLVGYFQSFKYWEDFKEEIIELLTPIHHFERESNLCSLHVRHGDYLKLQDYHPLSSIEYYEKAMELSGSSKFLIFSDDDKWCKENFKGNRFDFAEGQSPPVDLAMMAKKCENNIIANSSFSFWGAILNSYEEKRVFYPHNWFGEKLKHITTDICPSEWVKI